MFSTYRLNEGGYTTSPASEVFDAGLVRWLTRSCMLLQAAETTERGSETEMPRKGPDRSLAFRFTQRAQSTAEGQRMAFLVTDDR